MSQLLLDIDSLGTCADWVGDVLDPNWYRAQTRKFALKFQLTFETRKERANAQPLKI